MEVATREEWLAARRALLEEEKALTHAREAVAEKRRALPWVKIDDDYVFEGPEGMRSLSCTGEVEDAPPKVPLILRAIATRPRQILGRAQITNSRNSTIRTRKATGV